MRCPYLREAQVKFCRASAFKKMIVRTPDTGGQERCVSPDWVSCSMAKQRNEDHPSQSHCPFLHEMLSQYCSVSAVKTFIPYSDSQSSSCSNEGHRYCDAFVSLVNAGTQPAVGSDVRESVNDIPMPGLLFYARNHMWLDNTDESSCHVGIDAFLAWVIGTVDRITFLTTQETGRPVAVLTVGGVDLHMVFRNAMEITGINMHLRSHPEKITSEPYSLGWLFKGVRTKEAGKGSAIDAGLLRGQNARAWMTQEMKKMTTFVHEHVAENRVMADGGTFARGFLREINRDAALRVYNDFFSPQVAGRMMP
jgi:glycine cleavage system H lipoate-binding protein